MEYQQSLQEQAANLIADLAIGLSDEWCPSSMSTNIYDTAWVSMVAKPSATPSTTNTWLIPQAFQYILSTQLPNGSWDADGPFTNALLGTMAALLACLTHQKNPMYEGCGPLPGDIALRIARAAHWLEAKFLTWTDDGGIDSVALEILVPAHVRQLAEFGMPFASPFLETLWKMSEARLTKLKPEALYRGAQVTVWHSLEALVGRVDFDRLKSGMVRSSMLGSPSSTAVYLMYMGGWDEDAEKYLRDVFRSGTGKESGGFPSAAPIDVFEISWVLSTVLEAGFSPESLGHETLSRLASHLAQKLESSGGVLGFSTGMLPDADDTAKTLYALSFFEKYKSLSAESMVSRFWSPDSFKTYERESTRSISANCNVLKALLALESINRFIPQIHTAATFICDQWMSGTPYDKWNTTWEYCAMLSAQGLIQLLQHAESETINFLPLDLKNRKILITLSRIACQIMSSQAADGSFGNGHDEVTAYVLLTLIALSSPRAGLSFIREDMSSAIKSASTFLQANSGHWKPRRIWIEKVTYSSDVLTKAYCLAALKQSTVHQTVDCPTDCIESMQAAKLYTLFSSVPLFSHNASTGQSLDRTSMLRLAWQESRAYMTQLERIRFDVFPKPPKVNDKYLPVIPFAWTASSHLAGSPLPPTILMDMMELSLLNYQADEYMELSIPALTPSEISALKTALDAQLLEPPDEVVHTANVSHETQAPPSKRHHGSTNGTSTSTATVLSTLSTYTTRVFSTPHVRHAPRALRQQVRQELIRYLLAQIASVDGALPRLRTQPGPYSSFFEWLHTLGARDTSCPFSFAYFRCLVRFHLEEEMRDVKKADKRAGSKDGNVEVFEQEYLLESLRGSLAALCRIYNDFGSVKRDRDEGNLNSADFFFALITSSSFCASATPATPAPTTNGNKVNGNGATEHKQDDSEFEAERALWAVARLERENLDRCLERLEKLMAPGMLKVLRVFVDVTDLFGQIYVAEDIGSRTK